MSESSNRVPWIAALVFALLLCAVNLAMHRQAFSVVHAEGDEMTYAILAREMNWDLSHYTTQNDPMAREFPSSIYRQELFIHPPLLPLVIKTGIALKQPLVVGLWFEIAAMMLLFVAAWRAATLLKLSEGARVLLYAVLAFCPILLFSTSRLHHDAVMGAFLFAGLVFYAEALVGRSVWKAIVAGLLLVLAFNTRFNALAALPLLFAFPLYDAWRRRDRPVFLWSVPLIVIGMVLTLGMQHFYRLLWTYGTILPSSLSVYDPERLARNAFLVQVESRSRLRMLAYLLLTYPAWILILTPSSWKTFSASIRERDWRVIFAASAGYLLLTSWIFVPIQMRYYAPALPFAHLTLAMLVFATAPNRFVRVGRWTLVVVTLLLMLASLVFGVLWSPELPDVIPGAFMLWPPARVYYL